MQFRFGMPMTVRAVRDRNKPEWPLRGSLTLQWMLAVWAYLISEASNNEYHSKKQYDER